MRMEKELKVLRMKEVTQFKAKAQQSKESGQDVRRTIRPLKKVWMKIRVEKLES